MARRPTRTTQNRPSVNPTTTAPPPVGDRPTTAPTASSSVTRRGADGSTIITTTDTSVFDNGVQDVSIIPYMRPQPIQFVATGLRPQRRVWFFFDDVDINDYIIESDQITLTQNDDVAIFNTGFSNNDTLVVAANNQNRATVVSSRRFFDFENATPSLQDNAGRRRRRRILRLANTSGRFANAQSFAASVTGNTGTIGALVVRGAQVLDKFFENSSSNTIILPLQTQDVANNYWGVNGSNTIILMPRTRRRGRAVRAFIGDGTKGFDNVTRTLYLSNTAAQLSALAGADSFPSANSGNSIGNQISWSIVAPPTSSLAGFYTDREGMIDGTFNLPPNLFRTGERVFRIIDVPTNATKDCTTRADVDFVSSGLRQTKNKVVINSTRTTIIPPPPQPPPTGGGGGGGGPGRRDPIAQTFFVEGGTNPNGVFLSAIELWFRTKDEVLPVNVEIRPTVNGFPHSNEIIPFSRKTMNSDMVAVSENATASTKFKFDSPVYLEPGEYAIVVTSDSLLYEVFVSELGQKIIGTNRIVSEQPYLGSFFKSQNASTWDPIQLEDLMFELYKAKFVTSGEVTLYNAKPNSDVPVDMLYTHIEDSKLPSTTIAYSHSYDGGSNYYSYIPDTNKAMESRTTFSSSVDGSYRVKATMTTTDTNISPILYTNRLGVVAVENYIDDAALSNDDILITVAGAGYTPNASNLSVTIVANTGTGANAYATTNSTGSIISVTLDSVGSGYINTASIIINASNGSTTNASAIIVGENSSSGGPALTKYISRLVTLADTFDAGDLRVFVTAYKPSGTDIKVYYKVKNVNDSDSFNDKEYVLMNQYTGSSIYSLKKSFNDVIEYEFRPFGYPNAISYSTETGTFNAFKQFAIKVVMTSNDTTVYPVLHDLRAIALPSMQ